LTAIGVTIGLAGAAALTRSLQGMLFGLTPLDVPTYAAVAVAFAGVATLASYMPARRASKVDPLIALRYTNGPTHPTRPTRPTCPTELSSPSLV
jgi:ABC-type antimicrobial peptide transport system permease subunit